jgi:hypothetical protein
METLTKEVALLPQHPQNVVSCQLISHGLKLSISENGQSKLTATLDCDSGYICIAENP